VKLEKKANQFTPAFLPCQAVRAVSLLTLPDLLRRQTVMKIGVQSLPDFLHLEVMPGNVLLRRLVSRVLSSALRHIASDDSQQ
jgi:hypothetical protein